MFTLQAVTCLSLALLVTIIISAIQVGAVPSFSSTTLTIIKVTRTVIFRNLLRKDNMHDEEMTNNADFIKVLEGDYVEHICTLLQGD